ncbi:MAG TPA: hypothetical protein VJH94_01715 [Candidatus Paceibacterota bacterium]
MMGYTYGYGNIVGGPSVLCLLTWIVVIVDLVLVGIWLWQQISKK